MRILVVPDKFKGTLPAGKVCLAIGAGWKSARPEDELFLLPMSDGGEGFGVVMSALYRAHTRQAKTMDAAHRPLTANWWHVPQRHLAIIEAARVIGLAMLPAGEFHPFQLDTYGLGKLLKKAFSAGAKECLVGLGGSATNDAGFGLARALGWQFFDRRGHQLGQWWQLKGLQKILPPATRLKGGARPPGGRSWNLTVAVDVKNPLLGPRGCSMVYGPQKGLRGSDIGFAEQCLRRLKLVLEAQHGIQAAHIPGAGAAGGLGFGLMAFAGAKPCAGFEVFAKAAGLVERIRGADLVLTGEGALDEQTFMGKGVARVTELCREENVPCIVLAGQVLAHVKKARAFSARSLMEVTGLEQALRQPEYFLGRLARKIAGEFSHRAAKRN